MSPGGSAILSGGRPRPCRFAPVHGCAARLAGRVQCVGRSLVCVRGVIVRGCSALVLRQGQLVGLLRRRDRVGQPLGGLKRTSDRMKPVLPQLGDALDGGLLAAPSGGSSLLSLGGGGVSLAGDA